MIVANNKRLIKNVEFITICKNIVILEKNANKVVDIEVNYSK